MNPDLNKEEISMIVAESEPTMEELEEAIPRMAHIAFAKARREALDAGCSVWQSEDGIIFEVFPDGRRIERIRVEPPTPISVGTRFTIR